MTPEQKDRLLEYCKQLLRDKHRHLHERMQGLLDSAANETKSTAGDKHETALAMLQLEQEQLRRQMREVAEQLALLQRIQPGTKTGQVCAGSLIHTDKGMIFIATALGRINFENETVSVVSAASPLGRQLLGHEVNDAVLMNGISYHILSVS